MKKKRLIIMFGAPGSGKGMIGDALVEVHGFFKVSTGDILRNEVKNQTPLGCRIANSVTTGKLVDDETVNSIVKNLLDKISQDILLDGYPRNFEQCHFLLNLIKEHYQLCCVYLEAPQDLIVSRIEQRRICKNCGKTHLVSDGCCPVCGGESIIRKDDALIKERLNQYFWTTEQVFWQKLKPACSFVVWLDSCDITKATDKALDAFTPF